MILLINVCYIRIPYNFFVHNLNLKCLTEDCPTPTLPGLKL